VRIITLPENNIIDYIPETEDIYGMLFAPPCIEFSRALNGCPDRERDFIKGMNPVNACFRFIHRYNPVFWVIENPVGLLSRWLGKPNYIFDPWWYGDPWTKKTALWGKFNLPERKYFRKRKIMTEEQIKNCKNNTRDLPEYIGNRADKRAITPPGFARAFFEANR